jgi:hypothetical protein
MGQRASSQMPLGTGADYWPFATGEGLPNGIGLAYTRGGY